jgi:histidyl-tRNA synthetase
MKFDLNFARELDYYTCLILEASATTSNISVGSIIGGVAIMDLIGIFAKIKFQLLILQLGWKEFLLYLEKEMATNQEKV